MQNTEQNAACESDLRNGVHGGSIHQVATTDTRPLLLFAVVSLAISLLVQWKNLRVEHFGDDVDSHLPRMKRLESGDLTWRPFLFDAYNEHTLPIWFAWYYAEYKLFGMSVPGWHVSVTMVHWLCGLCLFALLRRYLCSMEAAWTGGVLWSTASFGMWDHPNIWIAATHLSFAFLFLLTAMTCLSGIGGNRSLGCAIGMTASIIVSVGFMGSIWILTLLLPLQWMILERQSKLDSRKLAVWFCAWLIPCVLLGAWVLSATPAVKSMEGMERSISRGFGLAISNYFLSGALLIFPLMNERWSLAIFIMVGAAVISALLRQKARGELRPTRGWRLMLVLFVVTGAFTLTACYFRSHQPFAQVISWSRFRYLPTFFWALTGGVIVEALRSRLSTIAEVYRFRKALGIVLIAIVLLNVKYAYDQWFMWFGPKDTVAQRHQMDDDVQGAGERCTI